MRLLVSLVLCSVLPGWGLCEMLCRSTEAGPAGCCAEISAVSCCDAQNSSASHPASMKCACSQHSTPSQDKTPAPTVSTFTAEADDARASVQPLEPSLNETALVVAQARPATRELLSLHQRLNL